ncbi:MAG: 50S ribosomal protein L9 [Planctomycetota bacterium]
MKVLLKHSVRSLGRAGEVVNVRHGYARNFLMPQGLAIEATHANLDLIEKFTSRRAEEEAKLRESNLHSAKAISELTMSLFLKANASNNLYGSVGKGEIVTQLNNRHINIEKSMVVLAEPIKSLGNYTVPIHLDEGIDAVLKIEIRNEHGELPAAPQASAPEEASEPVASGEEPGSEQKPE